MRLTMRTDLALRVLMYCAANSGRIVRKHEVAERCNASENHLAQVIHQLGALGYLHTLRGRGGGMRLARAPATIVVGAVFRDFEAALPLAECFDRPGDSCPLKPVCTLRIWLSRAADAFYATLDQVTLADLVRAPGDMLAAMQSLPADQLPADPTSTAFCAATPADARSRRDGAATSATGAGDAIAGPGATAGSIHVRS